MLKIALTGNYGSGKSTVLKIFGELGALCIDSDAVVEELLQNDAGVKEEVRAMAGDGVFESGAISKEKLAQAVFGDKKKLKALEGILHGRVIARIKELIRENEKAFKAAVVEAQLLFEKGYETHFDKTITVYLDLETSLKRLEQAGVPREEAMKRINLQMPVEEKARKSDFLIDNRRGLMDVRFQVEEVWKNLAL